MADNDMQNEEEKGSSAALYAVIILIIIGVSLVLLSRAKHTAPAEVKTPTEVVATTSTETMTEANVSLPAERAMKILAAGLGVKDSDITVVGTEEKVWPDSCLGLAKEGELCAQVVTPGYLAKLMAQGVMYQYRTDSKANQIRIQK